METPQTTVLRLNWVQLPSIQEATEASLDGDGKICQLAPPGAAPRCFRRGLVKTGVVSQIVNFMRQNQQLDAGSSYASSTSSAAAAAAAAVLAEAGEEAAERQSVDYCAGASADRIRVVRTLISIFETGAVIDRVGPLKLYHAQTYKRELSRISARNFGHVLKKAKRYNQLLGATRRHSLDSHVLLDAVDDAGLALAAPVMALKPREADRQRAMSSTLDDDFALNNLPSAARLRRKSSFLRAVTGQPGDGKSSTPVVLVTPPPSEARAPMWRNGGRSRAAVGPDANAAAAALSLSISQTSLQQPKAVELVNRRRLVHSDAALPQLHCIANGERRTAGPSGAGRIPIPPTDTSQQQSSLDLSSASTAVAGSRFVRKLNGRREKRITRFINFYNSSQPNQSRPGEVQDDSCSLSPSCSSSLSDSSFPNAAASAAPSAGPPPPPPPPPVEGVLPSTPPAASSEHIYREGILYHKQSSAHDRSWQPYWAFLIDRTLYLCPEKSMLAVSPTFTSVQKFVENIRQKAFQSIDVSSCIADIAYNQLKRKNVFRCITVKQSEHLFQAADEKDMIGWIDALHACAQADNQETVSPNSLALIIKRYERHSQSSASPSVRLKKAVTSQSSLVKGSPKTTSVSEDVPSSPDAQQQQQQQQQQQHQPIPQQQQQSTAGDHTLKRMRKWGRTKRATTVGQGPSCNEARPPSAAVFGLRLEDCVTTGETDFVPLVVQLCVRVVEAYGLETVGVYRIPGNTAAVNTLSNNLDQGFEFVEFDDIRWRDVNVVSSLLKAFFRKLPDPLLTSHLYRHFIEANRIESHELRLKAFRDLVRQLPKHNYETLRFLMRHLKRVVAHSAVNKMEAKNLALMFGPSLVRPSGENMVAMVTHMSDQCKIVESLIVYCDWIFGEESEKVDTSTADVGQLLNLIGSSERDLKSAKENIMRNLVNVRAVRSEYRQPSSPVCEERNIDEEIDRAYRMNAIGNQSTPPADQPSSLVGSGDQSAIYPELSASTSELIQAAEDYRRSREEQIYTARRIFIAGSSPADSVSNNIDGLARHCRHLNINNPDALDVLSPETREKIRQFQKGQPLAPSSSGRSTAFVFPPPQSLMPSKNEGARSLNSLPGALAPRSPPDLCSSLDEAQFSGAAAGHDSTTETYPDCGKANEQRSPGWQNEHLAFARHTVVNDDPSGDGEPTSAGAAETATAKATKHGQHIFGNLLKFTRKGAQERRRDGRRHTLGTLETDELRRADGRTDGNGQRSPMGGSDHTAGSSPRGFRYWIKESLLRRSNPDLSSSPSMPLSSARDPALQVHS